MSNYNLSDNVQDSFNFVIDGKKFVMRYPRTDEAEHIQEITNQLKEAQDNKDKETADSLSKKLEQSLYDFISPEGHEEKLETVLKTVNIKVMKNFNTMLQTELSIQ